MGSKKSESLVRSKSQNGAKYWNAHRTRRAIFPLGLAQEAAYPASVFGKVTVSPGRAYTSTDVFIVLIFISIILRNLLLKLEKNTVENPTRVMNLKRLQFDGVDYLRFTCVLHVKKEVHYGHARGLNTRKAGLVTRE